MTSPRVGILAVAVAAFAVPALNAQVVTPMPFTITLQSGEVLRGAIKSADKDAVVFVHEILGEVRLLRSKVSKSEPSLPEPPPPPPPVVDVTSEDRDKGSQAAVAAEAARVAAAAPKPAPPAVVVPETPSLWDALASEDEKDFLDGWNRSAELGMSMTSGNADTFNARANVNLNRATKKMSTSVNASYNYARDNNGESRNRGEARVRNDFNLTGSTPQDHPA